MMKRTTIIVLAIGASAGLALFEFINDGEYLGLPAGVSALLTAAALNVPKSKA